MAEGHPHGVIHEERDSVDGHHVHFPEDISANTEIQLQMKGASLVNAHLGFLQHKHKYEVQLKLPVSPTSNSLTPVINTPFIAVGSVKSLAVPSDNDNDKSKDERALERWDLDQLIMHSTTIHCTRKNRMYILSTVIFEEDGKGHEVILELDAHKEGLLRDKFLLRNEDDKEFVIVLHARVLGLRKGTPMLKEGIRCIHFEKDDEEDHSDWQGFE